MIREPATCSRSVPPSVMLCRTVVNPDQLAPFVDEVTATFPVTEPYALVVTTIRWPLSATCAFPMK